MPAADPACVRSGSNDKNEYRPRNPEDSLLYRTIAGHLETFLARQRERGREVPHSWNARCARICLVGSWPVDFCASSVNHVARIGSCRCRARVDPFVPPVAEGGWSTQRRTLWIVCFLGCPSGSGFSPSRSLCAIAWLTIRQ